MPAQSAAFGADTLCMNIVLIWLAMAGAAVLLVAVAVAWLEHRRRVASRDTDPAWPDTLINAGARVDAVDLDLNFYLTHAPPVDRTDLSDDAREQAARRANDAREQVARQAVLDAALSRMARQQAEPAPDNAWADTQPLVNAGAAGPNRAADRSAAE